jgi:hypothetical protein
MEFVGYRADHIGICLLEYKLVLLSLANGIITKGGIFLGLGRAYQNFIPNLGVLASPLNALTTLSRPEFDKYMAIKE